MYNRVNAGSLAELFTPISRRAAGRGVFFVRLCEYSPEAKDALWKFHEAARTRGVILEDQITNPDEKQLNYFHDMGGDAFETAPAFIVKVLEKWMPRMQPAHRTAFAAALCVQFDELKKKGKTDSILKNIYVKMMCWLYYKFERLMPFLGQDEPPRILYETGSITNHELILLRILSSMGADILLLEPAGDAAYLKQDPASSASQKIQIKNGAPFPAGFSLKQFRKEMAAQAAPQVNAPGRVPGTPAPVPRVPRSPIPAPVSTVRPAPAPRAAVPPVVNAPRRDPEAYFPRPSRSACTNAWMKTAAYTEILTPIVDRGDDFQLFYNAFIRVAGVSDELTYTNELFQFYRQLKAANRNIVVVDDELSLPGPEETQKIRRHPYRTEEELIIDIAGNLPSCANTDLQRLMQQSFVRTLKYAAEQEKNLNRLVVSAVYLLCWIQKYQSALFQGYKGNEIPCFILMGGCKNQHDALFIRYLAQLPVDVLILACDRNRVCTASGDNLLELKNEHSLPVPRFPRDAGAVQVRTLASGAEQELTHVLYTDSGIYRNRQFSRADAITLNTTYDEIFILWDQELKYRSSFSTENQVVNMPVIYAKVSGIEGGKPDAYWQKIKLLLGSGAKLVKSFPMTPSGTGNPFQSLAVKALSNGRLRREEIKAARQYPFSLLREDLQEHIFDKIQLMLDRKLIKGTFVNGTEYTVVATILNLEKDLVRQLQSFDFTRKNPKLVAICTTEQVCSLEDTILLTFLNLVGFDVVLFVPTGYQTLERWLNENYPVEHQIGDYVYDLRVPDFSTLAPLKRSWLDNIFKRGN